MSDEFDPLSERLRRGLAHRTSPELGADVVEGAAHRTPPRLGDPRRRLQVAGGATLAIAAVTVGALVATSPFDRAPLFTASGAQSGFEQDAAAMDLRIANWVEYRYEAGPGLGTEGGSGTVYELRRAGTPEAVLERVADAFGLDGEPERSQFSDEHFPSYVIGPEDGSGPSVSIAWSGTANWWFSDPGAYPPIECASAEGGSPEEADVCAVPGAPAGSAAPGEAEARAIALELFAATGFEVAADDIRVFADEWQTTATAGLEVDRVATALEWSIAWSPNGRIAWASGHAVDVVERGVFDTVSPTAAVDRLADGRWFGAPGPDHQGGMVAFGADALRTDAVDGVAPDVVVEPDGDGVATDPAAPVEPVEPGAPAEEPTEEPTEEPAPSPEPEVTILPEPLPEPAEPEVIVVTVDEAEPTLLLVWDAEGNAWLVPGYAMPHPDGWWNAVISLIEGVIELPEPMEIEPLILDDEATD